MLPIQQNVVLAAFLAALAAACGGASGSQRAASGPCAAFAQHIQDISDESSAERPKLPDQVQKRELGVRAVARSGALNTHLPDDPVVALELFPGPATVQEADIVLLAYTDGTFVYGGCVDVSPDRPTRMSVDDVRPTLGLAILVNTVWADGRPYNQGGLVDFLAIGEKRVSEPIFYANERGKLPPLLVPALRNAGSQLLLQRIPEGDCRKQCFDHGMVVLDLFQNDKGGLAAKIVKQAIRVDPVQRETTEQLPPRPKAAVRMAILVSGKGQGLYAYQDWE